MHLPHASERLSAWTDARRTAGRFLLALDFDGTLAPIVPRPGDAALPDASRRALEQILDRGDTDVALVSGRGLDDVRGRVGLADVHYAGNHGMEIDGPGVHRVHAPARDARPALDRCADSLRDRLSALDGVEVEDKGLTLSVHYRRAVDPDAEQIVRDAVAEACGADPGLRATYGKRVVEVRPAIDWDKGRAIRFLLDALGEGLDVPAVFVGDDRTDEDAFRAIRDAAAGTVRDAVLVGPVPRDGTAATCQVEDPARVTELLQRLAEGP